jgi:hypothetical protein
VVDDHGEYAIAARVADRLWSVEELVATTRQKNAMADDRLKQVRNRIGRRDAEVAGRVGGAHSHLSALREVIPSRL